MFANATASKLEKAQFGQHGYKMLEAAVESHKLSVISIANEKQDIVEMLERKQLENDRLKGNNDDT